MRHIPPGHCHPTTTLSIFLPDGTLLATVEGNGNATTTSLTHTDHLNSVAITSDKNDNLSELSAYYPYGAHRLTDLPSSGMNVKRGYIGQYEDTATELSYLNARYYDGGRGGFLSQDPAYLAIGDSNFENRYDKSLEAHLQNPQQLNSYSYAANNPLVYSDPSGEIVPLILGIITGYNVAMLVVDVIEVDTVLRYPEAFSPEEKEETFTKAGFDLATFGLGSARAFAPNNFFKLGYDLLGIGVDAKNLRESPLPNPNNPGDTAQPEERQVPSAVPGAEPRVSNPIQPTRAPSSASPTRLRNDPRLDQMKMRLDAIQRQVNAIEVQVRALKN